MFNALLSNSVSPTIYFSLIANLLLTSVLRILLNTIILDNIIQCMITNIYSHSKCIFIRQQKYVLYIYIQ